MGATCWHFQCVGGHYTEARVEGVPPEVLREGPLDRVPRAPGQADAAFVARIALHVRRWVDQGRQTYAVVPDGGGPAEVYAHVAP